VLVAAKVDPGRLVFVDEMGLHTSLAPLYGYSPKGERVRLEVPRNRGKNTTLLASMTLLGGMGETMAVEGSTDREVFEAYVERVLAPTLESGQIVIVDNLPAHKPARVRELIESRGCELVYLPAYSPDFNPIEEAFSKIKGTVRGAPSRSAHEGGFGGGVGRSAFGGQRPGSSRLFRACWLLSTSPTTVKRAVDEIRSIIVHEHKSDLGQQQVPSMGLGKGRRSDNHPHSRPLRLSSI
jgi:transposase